MTAPSPLAAVWPVVENQASAAAGDTTDTTRKARATTAARVAIWGGELRELVGDGGATRVSISRWGWPARHFESLEAANAWLDQVGAQRA